MRGLQFLSSGYFDFHIRVFSSEKGWNSPEMSLTLTDSSFHVKINSIDHVE